MVAVLKKCQKILPGIFDDFQYKGTDAKGYPYYEKVRV